MRRFGGGGASSISYLEGVRSFGPLPVKLVSYLAIFRIVGNSAWGNKQASPNSFNTFGFKFNPASLSLSNVALIGIDNCNIEVYSNNSFGFIRNNQNILQI